MEQETNVKKINTITVSSKTFSGRAMVYQCNIVLAGELKDKFHKTPNSITTDWRISDGAHRLYNLLLDLKLKQKYVTYEFLSSIIKKPNGKNLSVVTIKRLSKELQKAGWLEVQTHKVHINGKVQTVARYAVHVENASAPMSYNEQQQKLKEKTATCCKNLL